MNSTAFEIIWSCGLAYEDCLGSQPMEVRYMARAAVTASGRLNPQSQDGAYL